MWLALISEDVLFIVVPYIFDNYKVLTPTNALFIKLDKVLKYTLKIILTCSYMFRSTIIIGEPSLQPS